MFGFMTPMPSSLFSDLQIEAQSGFFLANHPNTFRIIRQRGPIMANPNLAPQILRQSAAKLTGSAVQHATAAESGHFTEELFFVTDRCLK